MKGIYCILLFLFTNGIINAQVTTIHQTFDTVCSSTGHIPSTSTWTSYDLTDSGNYWGCEILNGYAGTPCIVINGYYGGIFHNCDVDLLTPQMNLSAYPDSAYLTFYSKYQFAGAFIKTKVSTNYLGGNPDSSIYSWTDVTAALNPPISAATDSTTWCLHKLNLTAYKTTNVHVAFEYTSTATVGSRWFIDNVNTGPTQLSVAQDNIHPIDLTAYANSVLNQIDVWYNTEGGEYALQIYDMTGRRVYSTPLTTGTGMQKLTLNDVNLTPGFYIVKMTGQNNSGVAKVVWH